MLRVGLTTLKKTRDFARDIDAHLAISKIGDRRDVRGDDDIVESEERVLSTGEVESDER